MKKRITFDIDIELYNYIIELKQEIPYKISTSSFINTLIKTQIKEISLLKNDER